MGSATNESSLATSCFRCMWRATRNGSRLTQLTRLAHCPSWLLANLCILVGRLAKSMALCEKDRCRGRAAVAWPLYCLATAAFSQQWSLSSQVMRTALHLLPPPLPACTHIGASARTLCLSKRDTTSLDRKALATHMTLWAIDACRVKAPMVPMADSRIDRGPNTLSPSLSAIAAAGLRTGWELGGEQGGGKVVGACSSAQPR